MEHTLMDKMASWIPWSKKGKLTSEEEEDDDGLFSLPYPDIINLMLDYLDPKALLAMRLVSKRTKWWVDEPKYLSKLPITLHSSAGTKKMRKVLRARTDFCHFKIGFENRSHDYLISDFGYCFGPCLKVLDINTITNHHIMANLLVQCPLLDTLTILGINLHEMGSKEMEDLQRIAHILSNLKSFSAGNVLFNEEHEMEYFRKFLELCKNLKSVRFPYVNFQNCKKPKEKREEVLEKYLLEPIMSSIVRRGNFEPNLKYLILEYLNPLSPPLFYKVAEVCYRHKTILHNVHESHLKRPPGGKATHAVQEIIGTLDGLNANIMLGRLSNLRCISIWVSTALKLSYTNLKDAKLPKLLNINLFVDTAVEDDPSVERLVSTILGHSRPAVTNLKISYNSRSIEVSPDLVRGIDISTNFQYLRKLDIYQWDAYDEEFILLWKGLGGHRIQELSLLLCTHLSDWGLLGKDSKNPAILALTGLKELHVSSLYGSITDITIQRALKQMPLIKLRMYSQSLTYDGIASLMDGICCMTLEYMHCSRPLNCNQKEFIYLVKDILKAKNSPDPKKKNVRRRSHPHLFFTEDDYRSKRLDSANLC